MKRMGWIGLLAALLLAACAGPNGNQAASSSIEIKDGWVREATMMAVGDGSGGETQMEGSMSGSNSAAYMTIVNGGGSADRLVKVESDVADSVELHQSIMKDDVMTMSPVEAIEVPANGQAELKPGGYHVMLVGLKKDLMQGEKVHFTLTFEQAGPMEVDLEVRSP